MNNHEQIKSIADRIAYLRDSSDMDKSAIAQKLNMTENEYTEYEEGKKDFPISVIYNIANILKVDATELLTGQAPRMLDYTVTRKGQGVSVDRYSGYSFESLASNFINRDKEPMIVTITPAEAAKPVTHSGQEFNYVIEGKINVFIGSKTIELNQGDSIYFNPQIPHGQVAVGGVARFLTVIDKD